MDADSDLDVLLQALQDLSEQQKEVIHILDQYIAHETSLRCLHQYIVMGPVGKC